jgi:nucleoside-triphosphatase
MGKTLLLTGHPGSGKTTVIRKIVAQLGNRVGGFYTEEITGPGGRKGFRLITLDGQETVMAHKNMREANVPRVGRYGVDIPALEHVGVTALRRAMQGGKIVVVDEIGKMELFSTAFQTTVMEAILGRPLVLGTIMKKPYVEADVFKELAQVTIWEVDKQTRNALPGKILTWIKHHQKM